MVDPGVTLNTDKIGGACAKKSFLKDRLNFPPRRKKAAQENHETMDNDKEERNHG